MTRQGQKEEERRVLDAYLSRRRYSVEEVRPGPEPPDFIIEHSNRLMGAEVVEYHVPSRTPAGHSRREVEAAWENIRGGVVAYRETHPELDQLSVRLEFSALHVPARGEAGKFIEAAASEIRRALPRLRTERVYLRPSEGSHPLLRRYLRTISVRRVGAYMEWDWNHDFGGIGTSDVEMLAVIGHKLATYKPPSDVASSMLVIAGGARLSEIAAPHSVEELNSFGALEAALRASAFDEVGILCLDSFFWVRGVGWRPLGEE